MKAFRIPGTMRQLRWWLGIQRVYALSIGKSFAAPMNDTRPARSATPPEAVSSAVMALPVDRTPEARALYRLRIQNLLLSLPQGPEAPNEATHA